MKMRGNFQSGVTLVELMVAMAIGLVIILAAVFGLIFSKQGFMTIDAAAQLRDNGRFASEIITRVGVQAGFKDLAFALAATPDGTSPIGAVPSVSGFDNAIVPTLSGVTNPLLSLSSHSRTPSSAGCSSSTDTACANGSDILVLRFQTAELSPGTGVADKTMINCSGIPIPTAAAAIDDQVTNIFHVARSQGGEPALMCASQDETGNWTSSPVVAGVESFQVLYGVDGVTPNAPPTLVQDSVADRYLRAEQMVVSGNQDATNANWRRVRSLRIGLLVRASKFTAQDNSTTVGPHYPLGKSMALAADPGTALQTDPDGRLRQVSTFTIHLRNAQDR